MNEETEWKEESFVKYSPKRGFMSKIYRLQKLILKKSNHNVGEDVPIDLLVIT